MLKLRVANLKKIGSRPLQPQYFLSKLGSSLISDQWFSQISQHPHFAIKNHPKASFASHFGPQMVFKIQRGLPETVVQ